MGLPSLSVRKPVFVVMLFVAIVMLGIISLVGLRIELYQSGGRGIISIVTRARGGLAPQEVEKMITIPTEEAVATVSNVRKMYSNSREGESRVTLVFEPGTDMKYAALEVREKFSRVKSKLPKEIEKPVIANYSENDAPIITYSITSDVKTPEELREIIDRELEPLVARVPGVASVDVYGGRERKILIELDRDKMFAYGLSVEKIMDNIGKSNINLLAGTLDLGDFAFAVRTIGGFKTIDEIGEVGVTTSREGTIVPLSEIATVKDSYHEPQDHARVNLKDNVSLQVKKVSSANTIKVVDAVKRAVKSYAEDKRDILKAVVISNRAKSIKNAIGDVVSSLLLGVALTIFIIYLFLRRITLSSIILVSIPTSVIATFIMMASLGITINVMTLTGLSLAIGMLVDSSIVVLENIFKKRQEGVFHREAVITGSEEVWLPLLASTVTTIIVFLPIIFIDKEIQLLYQGLAFTVTAALIGSLFVSLMLVPMLASKLPIEVKSGKMGQNTGDVNTGKAYDVYRKMLKFTFRHRYALLILIAVLFVVSITGLANKDIDMPSRLEEREFAIIIFPIAGAKLGANNEVAMKIEKLLSDIPEVETYSTLVRKDDLKIYVKLVEPKKRRQSKDEIIKYIEEKGTEEAKTVHEDYSLIVDRGVAGEEGNKLVVNIFGHENDELEKLAHEFSKRMGQVEGLTNIVMTDLRKRPEYSLMVDKARAAYYNLTVKDIADSIHAQVRGMRPTKYHEKEKGKEIEAITRLQPIYRQKIEDLERIYVTNKQGEHVLLGELANFYPSFGPTTIDRRNKYRYVFVKGDVNAPLETVAKKVREAVKDVEFPKDYFYRFGGKYPELIKGKGQLTFAVFVTIILIYMVLASLFQSYSQPFLIMVAVPLATIGIYFALTSAGKPLSQSVFIGIIMLAGIVVNNSIILIDRINILKSDIRDRFELLTKAGCDRLRPIMMTTTSTVLGFSPMAFGWGQSSDLWSPLAITVMGGLISSTVLTLFIIPNFYLVAQDFGKFFRRIFRQEIAIS